MKILYIVDGLELIEDVDIEPGLGLSRGHSVEVDALRVFLPEPISDPYSPALLWAEGGPAIEGGFPLLDAILEALHLFAPGHAQAIARFWVSQPQWDEALRILQEPGRVMHLMEGGDAKWSVYAGGIEAAGVDGRGELVMHTVLPGTEPIRLDVVGCEGFPEFWKQWGTVDKTGIREALDAFRRASTITPEMKISALVQCLESLLSEGPGDLRYKVALRGAFLMENEAAERPALFNTLKKAYDIRSDVVHAKPTRQLKKHLEELERMCGRPLEEKVRSVIALVAFRTSGRERTRFLEEVDAAILGHSTQVEL